MARPRIGIFGALMALGGFLAVRYVQRNRAGQGLAPRDLHRWEGEGGTVATPAMPPVAQAVGATPAVQGTNGSSHPNGNGGAWPFPRS
ncbi:MAG TPA: hypothetical protein VFE79_22775 [Paraburkholderia sp.]|nr:hypothetical protein [Paraburkholderia sp.]